MNYRVKIEIEFVLEDDPRTDAQKMKTIAQIMETAQSALEGIFVTIGTNGGYLAKEGYSIGADSIGSEYGVRFVGVEKFKPDISAKPDSEAADD